MKALRTFEQSPLDRKVASRMNECKNILQIMIKDEISQMI